MWWGGGFAPSLIMPLLNKVETVTIPIKAPIYNNLWNEKPEFRILF